MRVPDAAAIKSAFPHATHRPAKCPRQGQTREYRVGAAEGWRRPIYTVLFGADIVFVGFAEVIAMFALFRLQDRPWERDIVFLALVGLTSTVVIAALRVSVKRRKSS